MTTLPTKNGSDAQTNTLYIRVQFAGTREYLPLGTLDKTVGAERAKELYLLVLGGKLEEAKTRSLSETESIWRRRIASRFAII